MQFILCYKLAVQKSFKTTGKPENKQVLLSVETFYSLFITYGCKISLLFAMNFTTC